MEKRKYLYFHLRDVNLKKNNLIYNYIVENIKDCTENSNGLLLNLSSLDDKHVNKLYDLYNLKEKEIDYDILKFEPIKKKKTEEKIYKQYELNNLEKLILSYS